MTRILSMLAGIVLLAPSLLYAQSGDADAGKTKAAACAACHGPIGVGISPDFPNLAGQVPGYVAQQLLLFKNGANGLEGGRENALMAGMVANLSDQDMADMDAYFSGLKPHQGSITPDMEEVAIAGMAVYRGGFAEFDIPACTSCHGPSGSGIAPSFPRVAGQSVKYLTDALTAFKTGARQNAMMNDIAFPLSEQQIEELATYISGLN